MKQDTELLLPAEPVGQKGLSRRKFFTMAGVGLIASSVIASCKKDDSPGIGADGTIDLGSGDIGILNYAYALEQLEASFYTSVMANTFFGMTVSEKNMLNDIRLHEIAHREFLKNALGSSAIPTIKVDFSAVNFSNREKVLATAKAFEDLGVAAYNGAGQLIENTDYLLLAGKIVSVEARHAAYIRDMISNGSFADNSIIDNNGMEMSKSPADVLAIAGAFIKTKITANNLPTS